MQHEHKSTQTLQVPERATIIVSVREWNNIIIIILVAFFALSLSLSLSNARSHSHWRLAATYFYRAAMQPPQSNWESSDSTSFSSYAPFPVTRVHTRRSASRVVAAAWKCFVRVQSGTRVADGPPPPPPPPHYQSQCTTYATTHSHLTQMVLRTRALRHFFCVLRSHSVLL